MPLTLFLIGLLTGFFGGLTVSLFFTKKDKRVYDKKVDFDESEIYHSPTYYPRITKSQRQ